MIINYLKVFFRNTIKKPFYSTINILGLAVGLGCSIVAFLYILNETSYNKGFEDYDKIYRIGSGIQSEMLNDSMPTSLQEVAPALVEQIPEIVAATRFVRWYDNSLIKVNNEYYSGVRGLISDSAMLDVFSFKILQGDPNSFLKSPTQIAITESLAKRVFKGMDPINQFITFEGENLEVAWVLEDPKKTMVNFELIANFEFTNPFKEYLRLDVYTFFKTKDYLNAQTEAKIRKVADKILLDAFSDWTNKVNSPVQALKDIYLHSKLKWEVGKTGSLKTLYIFGFLAFIILLIAVINYINLLTSHSEHRNKEVGIRKVVGAEKSSLKFQFLSESVLLTVISLLIGFVLAEFMIYLVNSKLHLKLTLFGQSNFILYFGYLLIAVIIGLLSGVYPAFVMARYSPLKVIKGVFNASGNSNFLKILLVIIQFSISTFLLVSILLFNAQIKYLKSKDLGFDEKNLVVLPECTKKIQSSYESIRNELISHRHIIHTAGSQSIPGWGRSGQSIRKTTDDSKKAIACAENRVQDFYPETIGLEIVQGRSFNPDFDDNRSIIINETAAKALGVENPIGLEVITNRESVIIGVVKDYHYSATTEKLEPLYLSNYVNWFNNIVVKINPDDKLNTLQYIKDVMMKYDPDYYWNYFFIEDMFKNQYKAEDRLFSLIFWGSGIALLLSVLGLFALTSYTVSKRFKEIGIRKTFGSTVNNIVYKLNRDIIRWVLFTNIIAWPAAYWVMDNWLKNYPYRIEIHWKYFIIASILSLIIALITISFQAIKAARMNPVDAIRYE
ncbi:MAG TPA: ABC transporter permease [Bacteroidales bacterium]|nr:ABC transporter permease [Bacteroidales bacterium]